MGTIASKRLCYLHSDSIETIASAARTDLFICLSNKNAQRPSPGRSSPSDSRSPAANPTATSAHFKPTQIQIPVRKCSTALTYRNYDRMCHVMDTRFEKRLLKAKCPRLRKHNKKRPTKFVRPTSHLDAFVKELAEDVKHAPSGPPFILQSPYKIRKDILNATLAPLALAGGLTIAAAQDAAEAVKRRLEKKARERALQKRRAYYAHEAAARQAQRDQIEQARPSPEHPCPTSAELTEAYSRRRESEEWKVRFGTLMIDLEEHVRRTYVHTGNKFTGSSGGVKDWLEKNCPLLAQHYSTCQRYKRKLQDEPETDSAFDSCT